MNIGTKDIMIESIVVKPLGTNCYIVTNVADKETMVVDPGGSYDLIKEYLDKVTAETGSKVTMIVNTHGHWDHVFHNADVKADYPDALIYIHEADSQMLQKDTTGMIRSFNPSETDRFLTDGMTLMLGSMPIKVLHTPGHSLGGVCLFFNKKYLICGDTIFKGSIGRTDLGGGSYEQLIESVVTKIFPLDDDVYLLPGHGPSTTIGYEKENNMFFK